MPSKRAEIPAISAELSGADLGDERLNRRLSILADQLAERPDESFPKALDDAQLEAAYRFFGNDRVSPEAILAPHFRQSARRAAERERVLVVHDTTQFDFPGSSKREGLGRLIRPAAQGFSDISRSPSAPTGRESHSACSRSRRSFGSTSRSVTRTGPARRTAENGRAGSTASTTPRPFLAAG